VVWKRLEGEQESGIALLNEVQEMQVPARIALRDRNDRGKIRFDQVIARGFRLFVVGQHVSREFVFFVRSQRPYGSP
jgi:hypothetical protein